MLTSQQLDISSRFQVNQIPPLNVTGFSEKSLWGPSITEYNLNFLTRCLMKAGKWAEFNLKLLSQYKLLYGAIFYWQCLELGRRRRRRATTRGRPTGRFRGADEMWRYAWKGSLIGSDQFLTLRCLKIIATISKSCFWSTGNSFNTSYDDGDIADNDDDNDIDEVDC